MVSRRDVVVRVGGEGGEGTITLGDLFTRIAAQAGLEVYSFRTYPAEIKGGQVMYQVRLGIERVHSEGDEADVLVAMNEKAWQECAGDLCRRSALIYEASLTTLAEKHGSDKYAIPAEAIAKELGWPMGKNFVLLGALIWFFKLGLERAEQLISRRMKRDLEKNLASLQRGYAYAQEHFPQDFPYALPLPEKAEPRLILSGADAMALGALAAGCQFFAGYPITPATPIMEVLARFLPAFEGTLVQAEDEIASLNMVLGASFAGKRAMTATSGPGLSLMIESLGVSSMAEIPLVLVDVQRAGPSTGLPTKTSQGDLFLALYGGHGDAPRFVLAPDSVKDCYYQMINAFSLAEYFQMPVIVLTDQTLAARVESVPPPAELWEQPLERLVPTLEELSTGDYRRYRHTETGISPMAIPGMPGGMYVADSLEHDEYGHPNQQPLNHEDMMGKRARKVETARQMLRSWKMTSRRWGDEGAEFGIIGWGSTRGTVREAMERLRQEGYKIEAIYPHTLLPMPDDAMQDFLHTKKHILIPELNYSGQFGRMIRHRYSRELIEGQITLHQLKKDQGIPFKIQEIYDEALAMIEGR